MGLGFRVLGFKVLGFWVCGLGLEFRAEKSCLHVGFGVQALCRDAGKDIGNRVQGSGFLS